ncbi:unnamed protein product [Schistosoma mattheei]|uniref:Uncharacterized protein n=1 Tax=Schistosoma mattheei TaxID=31246 RepID=A0A183PZA7_9TREM|nr:unnamed protein product [Schistosoma mattheei]
MDSYRTEINIPISRDKRTFEQRRKDMLSNLERSYSKHSRTDIHKNSSSESSIPLTESTISGSNRHISDWDDEVNRWISETRSKWSEDMKRMRQSMFALEDHQGEIRLGDGGWKWLIGDPGPRFRSIWHSSAGRAGNHEGTDGP